MNLFQAVDMREGNPVTQIVRFAIPMLLGNIAQQLYNTVDSIIVGRFVGDNALAAVGSAGPILNLMIVLFVGISVGATVMVSTGRPFQSRRLLHHDNRRGVPADHDRRAFDRRSPPAAAEHAGEHHRLV